MRSPLFFTPTLTGLAECVHLLSRDVGLETDIADVAHLDIGESELGLIRPSRVGEVS
jgi:hypothetical protein